MLITDVFDLKQGIQIKDSYIYENMGDIPVITGRNQIKGYVKDSYISEKDLPCITYPTKGNIGNCYIQDKIFSVNNTAVLIPKEGYKDREFVEWAKYKIGNILLKNQTSKDSVSYINKEFMKSVEFEVPSEDKRSEELVIYRRMNSLSDSIEEHMSKINSIASKHILFNVDDIMPLNEYLEVISRNDSLSEKFIYNFITNTSNKVRVLSGNVGYEYGKVPELDNIHYIRNKQGLQVITRGQAGEIRYLSKDFYATNTNSNIVLIKESKKKALGIKTDEDEKIYLKFLRLSLKSLFKQSSSSSDLSVLPLSKVIKTGEICFPKLSEDIINIVKYYDSLELYYDSLQKNKNSIKELMKKELK